METGIIFDPSDGNKAATSRWANINEKWFHFDSTSVMESGWIKPDAAARILVLYE